MRDARPVIAAIEELLQRTRVSVRARVRGREDLDRHQLGVHALAYLATELEAARRLLAWADGDAATDMERRIACAFAGELARSLCGGVALGPCEHVALADAGITEADLAATVLAADVRAFGERHASGDSIVALAHDARAGGSFGLPLPGDVGLDATRAEIRRFTQREVVPIAQAVHRNDVLVPLELVAKMAELGVFGMTIPEAYGGGGQGKLAMCVVTEEISRGSLGTGSIATRSEIAADLILGSGTDAQKRAWLPGIASGGVLPTAVFTEPDFGSDLAHVRTRATQQSDGSFLLRGQKTWITHATRADLMTVLARTSTTEDGYRGLSIFLAPKKRADGFVDRGLSGSEIKVLGYRGMKEYELSFDDFRVGSEGLLGGVAGSGFKQLMSTFETARIQTAARAVGVAQAALDEGMRYADSRRQFGRPILEFPRVARKVGRSIVLVMAARQLTYHAARAKDQGRRCDLEAGMAKLLATRAAWEIADATVQIHGGQGYAEESVASRLLVDARVLSIFEGASEIQAQVVARRLLEEQLS